MTENPGLAALALSDAVSDAWIMRSPELEDALDVPLVAVAPCATFAVEAAYWDGQRVVLRLREIGGGS